MADRDDLLRVDQTGTVHPVGRAASQQLRARAGEWRLLPGPRDLMIIRGTNGGAILKLAGEISVPGALCDVVALAAQSNWKGELIVISEAGTRSMYFDQGNVIGAATNVADERLGEMLYQFGVITREQLESIITSSAASGKRLGEAAIELGFVTAEEMYPMMAKQVEAVFYAALRVSEGTFYFFDRFDEKNIGRRHNLNAGGLLMEGARRMDEMQFFREKIPSEGIVPVPNAAAGKKIPDELQTVFAQCDGKRSIADIGRRIGELEFEVTKAVFQLLNAGLVQVKMPRPEGPEAIVEAFNRPLVLIHQSCDDAGKGAELRDGLGRFATGGGIYDPLFMMAGPSAEGTFRPERVAHNIAALAGDDPDAWITQLMMDYVGFALFHSESLLPREEHQRVSAAAMEMLKPLQSGGTQSIEPSSASSAPAPTARAAP